MRQGFCHLTRARMIAGLIASIFVIAQVLPAGAEVPSVLRELDSAFVKVAEKVTPAVVNIKSTRKRPPAMGEDQENFYRNHPFREFFGDEFFKRFKKELPDRVPEGMGSGVIISDDGRIITNAHVVKDADDIKVTLGDKRSFQAKVIGADAESDVAVIKIEAKNLPTAAMGDSSKLRVGEIVLAVGNPFGFNQTVTSGIVSATGRTNVKIIEYEDFIQTDAAINPGNSGGPLVNINGEVIGINTAIASRSGGYQGIGFAIPSNSAKRIMEDLLSEGKVRRGLLGVHIQDVNESLAKSFGRESADGALVNNVVPGSPAEKAGIQPGDIILEFNGQPVSSAGQLRNVVAAEKPGSAASVVVFRNKKKVTLSVTIMERTKDSFAQAEPSGSTGGSSLKELGIEVEKVPPSLGERLGLAKGEGIRVKDVSSDGAAARMGLMPGDVILEVDGKTVQEVSDFNDAVARTMEDKENKIIRLKVRRGNGTLFLAGPLG
jgi:serine protease Do